MKQLLLLLLISSQLLLHAQVKNDLMLKYLIKEPKTSNGILILLHGVGSNEEDLFSMAGQLPDDMTIISLRAPNILAQGAYAWFHLDLSTGKPVYNAEEAEKSRLVILQFIDEVKEKYHTNEIFLLGFSQGAIMSYSVALTHPEKVKGIVALSGRILSDIKPKIASAEKLKDLQVFIGHGINDQVLPIYNGQAASLTCTNLHIPILYKEYNMAHEISQQEFSDMMEWLILKRNKK
jgi:phospholipase/carboxylesterase